MSKHKFTGDRSDMAHRIKEETKTPAPPAERVLTGYGKDGKPEYIDTPYFGGTRGR